MAGAEVDSSLLEDIKLLCTNDVFELLKDDGVLKYLQLMDRCFNKLDSGIKDGTFSRETDIHNIFNKGTNLEKLVDDEGLLEHIKKHKDDTKNFIENSQKCIEAFLNYSTINNSFRNFLNDKEINLLDLHKQIKEQINSYNNLSIDTKKLDSKLAEINTQKDKAKVLLVLTMISAISIIIVPLAPLAVAATIGTSASYASHKARINENEKQLRDDMQEVDNQLKICYGNLNHFTKEMKKILNNISTAEIKGSKLK